MAGYLIKPPFIHTVNWAKSISKGIIGAWPFIEKNYTNLEDVSGRGHKGTSTGTVTHVASPWGSAASMASTDKTDRINIPNSSDFDLGDGTTDSPHTFFVVAKLDSLSNNAFICKDSIVTERQFLFRCLSGKVRMLLFDTTTTDRIGRQESSVSMSTNVWYKIISTYDGSASSSGIKIYIDAVRVDGTDSNAGSYTSMKGFTSDLMIGAHDLSNLGCEGDIANAVIWNRELSFNEISQLNHDPFAMYRPSYNLSWIGGAISAATGGLLERSYPRGTNRGILRGVA